MIRGGMQEWPLRVHTILDHAKRVHGDREVVTRTVEGPIHRTTYAEIHDRSRQVAAALQRLGAKQGDRIGTLAWNTHRHVETWYGAAGIGAIYHTINPRLFEEQIEYIIKDADDRLIFTDLTFIATLEKRRDTCLKGRRIVALTDAAHMPDSPLDLLCYEDLIGAETPDFEWAQVPETTPVGLCYTSGTTGAPKGVVYTHRSNVLHSLACHGPDGLAFKASSTVMPIVPMFHANAWTIAFSAPMAGAKLVLPGPKLDGASLVELLDNEAVTMSAGVPTVWIGVIDELRRRGFGPKALERVLCGGSACPAWIMDAFGSEFGVEFIHAWGMTELSPVGTFASPRAAWADMSEEDKLQRRLKQGAAIYTVEARVVDETGEELPSDGASRGRLQVRGAAVVSEYFNGAGGDVLDEDGWFDTGDLATLDHEAFVQITDRTKDVIKSGGEWISSVELENHASCHPDIAEAAAIGVPCDRWGERPLLIAVPVPGAAVDEAALLDFLRPRIAKWWVPERVAFITDMPHTATGKINKLALRERFVVPV